MKAYPRVVLIFIYDERFIFVRVRTGIAREAALGVSQASINKKKGKDLQ